MKQMPHATVDQAQTKRNMIRVKMHINWQQTLQLQPTVKAIDMLEANGKRLSSVNDTHPPSILVDSPIRSLKFVWDMRTPVSRTYTWEPSPVNDPV